MSAGLLAALLAASNGLAAAPLPASAKAYVENIYRAVGRETFDYHSVRFAPPLAALMRRDAAYSDRVGGVGALEADPFCECQDTAEDYRLISASVAALRPGFARVTVLIRNGGPQRFVIEVEWLGGAWRVADIHGSEVGSLLVYLRREIAREEAEEKRL